MLTPQENPSLIGHQSQMNHMLSAYHANQFAHGWILTGSRGIGKATFAFHLARYIFSKRQNRDHTFA